jgi:hypothetical protein
LLNALLKDPRNVARRLLRLSGCTMNHVCSVITKLHSPMSYLFFRRFHVTSVYLSGHSKWSTIKHKKGIGILNKANAFLAALDEAKMLARTRMAARITTAVRGCKKGGVRLKSSGGTRSKNKPKACTRT